MYSFALSSRVHFSSAALCVQRTICASAGMSGRSRKKISREYYFHILSLTFPSVYDGKICHENQIYEICKNDFIKFILMRGSINFT